MHEISLAGGILQVLEDSARREVFTRVQAVRLSAPALAGVEVSALRFALEALAPGTLLEGARIDIDEPPGQAWCLHCSVAITLANRTDACPHCGSWRWQVTGGTELQVIDLLVD